MSEISDQVFDALWGRWEVWHHESRLRTNPVQLRGFAKTIVGMVRCCDIVRYHGLVTPGMSFSSSTGYANHLAVRLETHRRWN